MRKLPLMRHRKARAPKLWSRSTLAVAFVALACAAFSSASSGEVPSSDSGLVIHDGSPTADGLRPLIDKASGLTAHGDLDGAEAVWLQIREAYPNHPAGFVLAIDTLHWRKSVDFMSTEYDPEIQRLGEKAIALCDAWLERSPKSAEAYLYKGVALVALMKMNGMQGNYYKAGSQGEAGRVALETALELDPELADAKLPLGTYYYYASIATRYIRWLTWLWFVPTGEHDRGLAYVAEAAAKGDLLKFEAMTQASRIYLYNEDTPHKAEPIIKELAAKYPDNSYVRFEALEVALMTGDYTGAIDAALAFESGHGEQCGDERRRSAAKIWRARALMLLGRADEANAILSEPGLAPDALNQWERRWLLLTEGNLLDLAGSRGDAVQRYQHVVELETRWGSDRTVNAAKAGLDEPYQLSATQAPPPSVAAPPHGTQ
jgi:predicted negative regulator of RcsB-dependent stress response